MNINIADQNFQKAVMGINKEIGWGCDFHLKFRALGFEPQRRFKPQIGGGIVRLTPVDL